MVNMLTQPERNVLDGTIRDAESRTSAELVMVIAPASDAYQSAVLLYGFLLGSLIALLLWITNIVPDFPLLMAVQITTLSMMMFVPFLNALCLRMVPERIGKQRAARRAYEEYQAVSRHVPTATPIVLFYISLAERYAHIVQSRSVREKIPDSEWAHIVRTLTAEIASGGLCNACVNAVESSAKLLIPHFPERAGMTGINPTIIEKRS